MEEDKGLANYMVRGMIIGSLVGTLISILFLRENTFLSIAGGGFGLSFGMLISIVVWGLKNKE